MKKIYIIKTIDKINDDRIENYNVFYSYPGYLETLKEDKQAQGFEELIPEALYNDYVFGDELTSFDAYIKIIGDKFTK